MSCFPQEYTLFIPYLFTKSFMLNENKFLDGNDGKEYCVFCNEIIDECQCDEPPICPVCGDEASLGGEISLEHLDCEHLIAGWDDSGFHKSPLDGVVVPVLPTKLKSVQWSAKRLKEAFGKAEPLSKAYGGNFTEKPDEKELLEVLINLVPSIVEENYYDQPSGARIGWEALMYFTKAPDTAYKQISELMKKLQEGFKKLEISISQKV